MKDQLIEQLLKYMQETKDFILDQAPDIYKQLINFSYYRDILQIGLSLGFLAICIYFYFFAFHNRSRFDGIRPDWQVVSMILTFVFSIISVFLCVTATFDL